MEDEVLKELTVLVYGMNVCQLAEEITRITNEESGVCDIQEAI